MYGEMKAAISLLQNSLSNAAESQMPNRRPARGNACLNGLPNLTVTTQTPPPTSAASTSGLSDGEDDELRALVNDLDSISEGTGANSGQSADEDEDEDCFQVWDAPNAASKRHRRHDHPLSGDFLPPPSQPDLKVLRLRHPEMRTRKLAHQNGLTAILRWLQASGMSLSRFVAGQTHLEPRDKQEVDHLLQILLLLTDQFHPDDAALVEATDPLIRRIMALCLQTKLDSDFLEVFTNPSGSHLAPLGLLTEANKVFQVIKKARGLDSKSLFPTQHTPSLPQSSRVVQVHQTGQQMTMPHMMP